MIVVLGLSDSRRKILCQQRSGIHVFSSIVKPSVAQSGSASALGAEGREFESLHSDHYWGISSSGRAIALQAIGDRFEPDILHHYLLSKL